MGDAMAGDHVEEQAVANSGPDVENRWTALDVGGSRVLLRIVRPAGCAERLPVVLYLHGGGWVSGDASAHDRLVRELSVGAHAAVVSIGYDRPPDTRHAVANRRGGVLTILAKRPREMTWFWSSHLASEHGDALIASLWAGLEHVAGLPEAFVIVDEHDLLRDEAEAYASRMTAVRERSHGTLCDFIMLNPVQDFAGASSAIAQASLVLRDAWNSPCLQVEKDA
ncbi:alpha/beta hydrolase [Mycobacterium sp. URHB0021]